MYITLMNDIDELTIDLEDSEIQSKEKIPLRLLLICASEFSRNLQVEKAEQVISLFRELFEEKK
jgi:hypothetical protein